MTVFEFPNFDPNVVAFVNPIRVSIVVKDNKQFIVALRVIDTIDTEKGSREGD